MCGVCVGCVLSARYATSQFGKWVWQLGCRVSVVCERGARIKAKACGKMSARHLVVLSAGRDTIVRLACLRACLFCVCVLEHVCSCFGGCWWDQVCGRTIALCSGKLNGSRRRRRKGGFKLLGVCLKRFQTD